MKHKTLIENPFPLHLLLRYKLSKPLPIAVATHLQREGVLTICKCRKYREKGFRNPFWLQNVQKTTPKCLQSMPEGWEMDPQIPFPNGNHFLGVWGTLLGKPS